MEFLCKLNSLTLPLRALACSARCVPHIPSTRPIYTGRPRPATFPTPPSAPRRFERTITPTPNQALPASTTGTPNGTIITSRSKIKTQTKPSGAILRRPTNRQIPFDHVFVLDPDTNKLSQTKRSLDSLLLETREEKKRGTVVELVTSIPQPIVRLTTRSEAEERYRDMKRALKKGTRVGEEPKEVQLAWGVGRADLEHKLRKAGRDLEKGYRVAVVITSKYKSRPSSQREWVAFADEISETLSEVGEEWKEREVTDRMITLSFRLKATKGGLHDDVP